MSKRIIQTCEGIVEDSKRNEAKIQLALWLLSVFFGLTVLLASVAVITGKVGWIIATAFVVFLIGTFVIFLFKVVVDHAAEMAAEKTRRTIIESQKNILGMISSRFELQNAEILTWLQMEPGELHQVVSSVIQKYTRIMDKIH